MTQPHKSRDLQCNFSQKRNYSADEICIHPFELNIVPQGHCARQIWPLKHGLARSNPKGSNLSHGAWGTMLCPQRVGFVTWRMGNSVVPLGHSGRESGPLGTGLDRCQTLICLWCYICIDTKIAIRVVNSIIYLMPLLYTDSGLNLYGYYLFLFFWPRRSIRLLRAGRSHCSRGGNVFSICKIVSRLRSQELFFSLFTRSVGLILDCRDNLKISIEACSDRFRLEFEDMTGKILGDDDAIFGWILHHLTGHNLKLFRLHYFKFMFSQYFTKY